MWPTYFIPGIGDSDIILVGGGCGEGTSANGYSVTLSGNDFGFRAGDFVWVFVEVNQVLGAQRVASSKDINLLFGGMTSISPIKPVWDVDTTTANSAARSGQPIGVAWLRWTSADSADPSWTFTTAGTPFRVCIYGFRNVHPTDPLPVLWRDPNHFDSNFTKYGSFNSFWAPIPYMDRSVRFDLAFEGLAGSSYTILNADLGVPSGADVLLSLAMNRPGITTENESEGLISFVARKPVAGEGNNLLPYSDLNMVATVMLGWVGVNESAAKRTATNVNWIELLAAPVAGQPCGFYRDVTATAGKTYFWCAAMGGAAPSHPASAFGYEVAGTYYGFVHRTGVRQLAQITNSPRYVFGPHLYDTVGSYGSLDLYGVYIGPFESDTTVRLWFGHADAAANARIWTTTGGAIAGLSVGYVGLHEVPDDTCMPALVGSAASPVTDVQVTFGRCHALWGYKQTIATVTEQSSGSDVGLAGLMRHKAAAPFQTDIRDWRRDPREWQATSATQFRRLKDNSYEWSIGNRTETHNKAWVHPRLAVPGLGHDKLYFEATVTTLDGAATTADRPAIYINSMIACWAAQNAPQTAMPTGITSTYRAGYSAQGRFVEHGTSTTGLATWGLSDTIGAALDLSANTIDWYKNGIFVRTTTLPTGMSQFPAQAEIVFGELDSTTAIPAFSINFTGPFDGRKPVGFEAWDWPNEIT